jgi:uracil-DNA glycosylase
MIIPLHCSWNTLLQDEFSKTYFKSLITFVDNEYRSEVCYPPKEDIFSAFKLCTFDNLKVVIIGQDPYHSKGQANGLCFSVGDGVRHPPSLKNIFKEMESDLGHQYPESGNLEYLAKQGVLLLNATLTVRAGQAGSHQNKGWEKFTDKIIAEISCKKKDIVFLLWGGFAKKKIILVNTLKHTVFTSGHPSPLSANRGYWFGNKNFSKTNEVLLLKNKKQINW